MYRYMQNKSRAPAGSDWKKQAIKLRNCKCFSLELDFSAFGDTIGAFEGVIPRGAFRVMLFRQYGRMTRIAERMRLMRRCLCMSLFCIFLDITLLINHVKEKRV